MKSSNSTSQTNSDSTEQLLGNLPTASSTKSKWIFYPVTAMRYEILVVQKDITVLAKGEDKPPYDPCHDAIVEECKDVAEKPASKKSRDCIGESSELDTDLQAAASNFELRYGKGDEEKVV